MTSPLGPPGTPESPFSPEIQNILDDGGMSGAGMPGAGGGGGGGGGGMSSVFRSHSVPVQDMLGCAGQNKQLNVHSIFVKFYISLRARDGWV